MIARHQTELTEGGILASRFGLEDQSQLDIQLVLRSCRIVAAHLFPVLSLSRKVERHMRVLLDQLGHDLESPGIKFWVRRGE